MAHFTAHVKRPCQPEGDVLDVHGPKTGLRSFYPQPSVHLPSWACGAVPLLGVYTSAAMSRLT